MKIHSISVDIQRKGIFIGQRQLLVNFAVSNTSSVYKDVPVEGKEYLPEEFLAEINNLAKQKPQLICFGGGEPLLQIDYYKKHLENLPLPLYVETNGTLPNALAEIAPYVSMFGVELIPDFEKEFTQSLINIKNNDFYVRLVVTKEITPKQTEDFAKIIASVKPQAVFVLEPLFGVKNYLSLQALALRHLSDVRVIPRLHI